MKVLRSIIITVAAMFMLLGVFACGETTVEKSLEKIELVSSPVKLTYNVGETPFKVDGGSIRIIYSDGSTEQITMTTQMITFGEGGISTVFNPETAGIQDITVSYAYNNVVKTLQFQIEVILNKMTVTDIAVNSSTQVSFKIGFPTNQSFKVFFNNGLISAADRTTLDGKYIITVPEMVSAASNTLKLQMDGYEDYDAEVKYYDLALEELKSKRSSAIDEITAAFNGFAENDYTPTNYSNLVKILADFIDEINEAESVAAINALISGFGTETAKIPTKAQTALADAKTSAINEINSFADGLIEAEYPQANWAQIQSLITAAKNTINKAVLIPNIDTTLSELFTNIAAVKKYVKVSGITVKDGNTVIVDMISNEGVKFYLNNIIMSIIKYVDGSYEIMVPDLELSSEANPKTYSFTVKLAGFEDVTQTIEYRNEELRLLLLLKTEAKADLEAYAVQSDYNETNWAAVVEIVGDATEEIEDAADADSVRAVAADAKEAIDKIETKVQITARELAEAKTKALKDLDDLIDGLDESNYSVVNWTEIQSIYSAAKLTINAATVKADVINRYGTAENAVKKVDTKIIITGAAVFNGKNLWLSGDTITLTLTAVDIEGTIKTIALGEYVGITWFSNGTVITGADLAVYRLRDADVDKVISLKLTTLNNYVVEVTGGGDEINITVDRVYKFHQDLLEDNVYIVDSAYKGVENHNGNRTFTDIQRAIDAAEIESIVFVKAGIYSVGGYEYFEKRTWVPLPNEPHVIGRGLQIYKPLKLWGANFDEDPNTGTRKTETIIIPNFKDYGTMYSSSTDRGMLLEIHSDRVEVNGLTLDGYNENAGKADVDFTNQDIIEAIANGDIVAGVDTSAGYSGNDYGKHIKGTVFPTLKATATEKAVPTNVNLVIAVSQYGTKKIKDLNIKCNIIQNASHGLIDALNSGSISETDVLFNNWISGNYLANSYGIRTEYWGIYGSIISVSEDFYVTVDNNVIENAITFMQIQSYYSDYIDKVVISNNTVRKVIQSIWFNLAGSCTLEAVGNEFTSYSEKDILESKIPQDFGMSRYIAARLKGVEYLGLNSLQKETQYPILAEEFKNLTKEEKEENYINSARAINSGIKMTSSDTNTTNLKSLVLKDNYIEGFYSGIFSGGMNSTETILDDIRINNCEIGVLMSDHDASYGYNLPNNITLANVKISNCTTDIKISAMVSASYKYKTSLIIEGDTEFDTEKIEFDIPEADSVNIKEGVQYGKIIIHKSSKYHKDFDTLFTNSVNNKDYVSKGYITDNPFSEGDGTESNPFIVDYSNGRYIFEKMAEEGSQNWYFKQVDDIFITNYNGGDNTTVTMKGHYIMSKTVDGRAVTLNIIPVTEGFVLNSEANIYNDVGLDTLIYVWRSITFTTESVINVRTVISSQCELFVTNDVAKFTRFYPANPDAVVII